ncbi:NUDIX domain-containing protein [Croceicoccus naphthovorans]|nr:NUDIX hydrolase [Croceicoccus naphthovorans]MBB3989736.1 ADP-ribose pyrophosphatase YjhB (NUDIX family) [Croceicoccus naphthovorans]
MRGCAIVARRADGHVLMVRHSYRKRGEWHVPTGGVRKGEAPEVAARRELAEEVGVAAITLTTVHVEEIDLHGARNSVTVFAATYKGEPRADEREIAEIGFFAPDALPDAAPAWVRKYVAVAVG